MNVKKTNALFLFLTVIITIFLCPPTLLEAKTKSPEYSFDVSSLTLYMGWDSYLCDILGTGEEAEISYRSGNENIVFITPEGEIFPVSKGKTKVYADVTEKGKTTTCSIKRLLFRAIFFRFFNSITYKKHTTIYSGRNFYCHKRKKEETQNK